MKAGLRLWAQQLGLFDEAPAEAATRPAALPDGLRPCVPPLAASPAPAMSTPTGTRTVQLEGQPFAYQLTRAARRSIGFSVGPNGLQVRAPRWVSVPDIERVLVGKSAWIVRQWQRVQARERQQQALRVQWGEGAELPYLGQVLRVERLAPQEGSRPLWQPGPPARLALPLPTGAQAAQWRDATQAWLQGQARAHFAQRVPVFAERLGVAVQRVRLSSAQGRWGSASGNGVISLNWRLMHFSPAVIDYVVAHEVAHLREMNHGPRFWALVETLMPEFEQHRDRLKTAVLPGF